MKKREKNLVSIIIPTYNVESYIAECINSCLNQTYKNIEILVIDDGSSDKSGKIADDISKNDPRVIVFHKENSGVSSARNFGIKKAIGDYVIFVDGDDYLSNNFVEYMLSLIEPFGAEFGMSRNCYKSIEDNQIVNDKILKYNKESAIELLLSLKMDVGCWNKIYKRSLLIDKKIFFNEELFYGEGLQFITNVAQNTDKIAVGERREYYYRQNNMSSATTKFNYNKFLNGEKSLMIIKNNMQINSKKVNEMWELHYCIFCVNALLAIISNKNKMDKYEEIYKEWHSKIKKYSLKLIFISLPSFKDKIRILLASICPKLFSKLRDIRNINHIKKSV